MKSIFQTKQLNMHKIAHQTCVNKSETISTLKYRLEVNNDTDSGKLIAHCTFISEYANQFKFTVLPKLSMSSYNTAVPT